ncbi:Protein artemis [Colletotrichum trifolii]|uniref:Protein artemis n=1 Tax=Colletotrichum trifolii TaxID=5466 RepID=A0A4R8PYB8_COLTR|nr:Protein artemis [Colletotrichum trifolii]
MSTFNGLVAEFPDIRIDFFRRHSGRRPPLACFLSHVHSDHLAGLDSLRSPFVYCSAATREILLRLERYPCRINYAKGILEARVQTYKHLKNLLKPLPLDTPTTLELAPGKHIQVTLFDANHCPGSVMFLIEDGKYAILYTGDIRSEPWFVNAIARNPAIVEYTSGIKVLDKIYIDTSFIQDVPFEPKSAGIAELLRKIEKYPKETIFHMQAWTYGYEQVWIALSKALGSKIHVDDYKMRVFSALTPVVAHLTSGGEMAEIGVGGGGDDLERDAELEPLSPADIESVLGMLDENPDFLPASRTRLQSLLEAGTKTGRTVPLDMDIASFGEKSETAIMDAFRAIAQKGHHITATMDEAPASIHQQLPKTITFPYSRHSSYQELCDLVQSFRPRDVWPCTVNPIEWIKSSVSIKSLFGQFCSGDIFAFDLELEALLHQNVSNTQQKAPADRSSSQPLASSYHVVAQHTCCNDHTIDAETTLSVIDETALSLGVQLTTPRGATQEENDDNETPKIDQHFGSISSVLRRSQHRRISSPCGTSRTRSDAYINMAKNLSGEDWVRISLLSTADHHTVPEMDLGAL